MNENMLDLMERRDNLLRRISEQREQLAEIGPQLERPLSMAERGVAVARFLRIHPWLVAGVAAFLLMRRRNFAGLAWVGWRVWKIFRGFTSISAKLFS
jgi:YqjK-like protein